MVHSTYTLLSSSVIVTVAELGLKIMAWSEESSRTIKTSLSSKSKSPDMEILTHDTVVEAGNVRSITMGV